VRKGFRVRVLTNATAAVGNPEPALCEMREAGIELVQC
jgi:hypothetical protein